MRFFDPEDEVLITHRKLPHWSQEGSVVFITWRTSDSMPKAIVDRWRAERNRWLVDHGIDPTLPQWRVHLQALPDELLAEFHDHFTSRWHHELDAGHGDCVLAQPEIAKIVHDSLLHFDGERYEMLGFVVMPNHVHLLATFSDKESMLTQCDSWKHFTAREIQRRLGTRGRFWQKDAFDHLVRHEAQYLRLRSYIAENPKKAGLVPGRALVWLK